MSVLPRGIADTIYSTSTAVAMAQLALAQLALAVCAFGFFRSFMGTSFSLAIDSHSKWSEVYKMTSTAAVRTMEVLHRLLAAFGLSQVVTDNRSQFVSEEFEASLINNGIEHTRSAPYHPASNGEAEHFVCMFKQSIKARKYDSLILTHRLQPFLVPY